MTQHNAKLIALRTRLNTATSPAAIGIIRREISDEFASTIEPVVNFLGIMGAPGDKVIFTVGARGKIELSYETADSATEPAEKSTLLGP